MNLVKIFGLVVVLALAGCSSYGPTASSRRAEIGQIDASLKLAQDRHFSEAEAIIQPVIRSKHFGRLPTAQQYRALLTAARLAFTLKEPELEYESRVRLLALPEATADDRLLRLNAANRLNDTSKVIISLTDFAQKSPETLDRVNSRFIQRKLAEGKKKLPHGATLPLMRALYAAHWKLEWGFEPSGIWRDLALLLLEQNRLSEAIDVSTHVSDEYVLIAMRADRRFDAITLANPAQFDVDAAIRQTLEHVQAMAQRAPKSLTPRMIVTQDLMEQQHYGAALATADDLVVEIRSHTDPRQWYDDFDDRYVWILDTRSRLLRRLGRWDEGIDQLAAASYVPENNAANVSQIINLGDLYCDLGKPAEALQVLARLGSDMSPYGRMQAAYVRLDAALQMGDAAEKDKWLAFIKEHRIDAPRTYDDALLRTDDSDTAAKWLIERLEDKDLRAAALLSIQGYAVPRETPRQAELRERKSELMARSDVQAAVAKVGRIEKYNLEALEQ